MRKYRPLSAYVDSASEVLAGENMVTPAAVILSMTDKRHARRGGADDHVDVLREETVRGLVGLVGRRVAGVALDAHDVLAEHATVLVDLLEGQVEPGELRRSEERQRTRLRQQRAERQRAVAGAAAFDRGICGTSSSGPPSAVMYWVWLMSMRLLSPIFSRP